MELIEKYLNEESKELDWKIERMHKNSKKWKRRVTVKLLLFIIIKTIAVSTLYGEEIKQIQQTFKIEKHFLPAMISSSTTFFILGILFLVISLLILRRLYIFQADYYEEHSTRIKFAVAGLTLPLFIRSLWYIAIVYN